MFNSYSYNSSVYNGTAIVTRLAEADIKGNSLLEGNSLVVVTTSAELQTVNPILNGTAIVTRLAESQVLLNCKLYGVPFLSVNISGEFKKDRKDIISGKVRQDGVYNGVYRQ